MSVPTITLQEARVYWRETIRGEGGHCPCCDRWGKMYRRGINMVMAAGIVWLARHSADGSWVDVPRVGPRFVVASNQLPTMRWWGLCERNIPGPDDDKKFSGFWRVTEMGKLWANNEVKVMKYVWTYNDTVIEFEGPDVAVSDCLEKFSYNDVMNTDFTSRKRT